MQRLILGFVTGTVVLVLCVVGCLELGLADVRADVVPSAVASRWMSSSVHASIARSVPADLTNTQAADDDSLIAVGKLYLNDCVGCHSAPGKPPSSFGATFYPPAPQLARDGKQYSDAQIFWMAKHGIRRTGMAAQASSYSDQKLWPLCRIHLSYHQPAPTSTGRS